MLHATTQAGRGSQPAACYLSSRFFLQKKKEKRKKKG
jgi:hypothetical protein